MAETSAEDAPKVCITEKVVTTRRASYRRQANLLGAFFGLPARLTMGDLRTFVAGASQIGGETGVVIAVKDGVVTIQAEETEQHDDAEATSPAPEEKEDDREV